MAIGRQILSGLFGATAGGLSGFAQQKAEERARMQRQMEREEERAYQRGLTAEARRYQEALAAREALMRGDIVAARQLAPEPEAEVATPESTAETLKSFITGARMGGAGVGLARGATDAAPFGPLVSPDYDAPAISEKDRRDIRSVGGLGAAFRRQPEPLRAEYAQPETAAPERQAIELAGEKYEIVTPAERRARELEAERGGLDAIDVARLREVARGSEASPEREGARAVLSDIGVSYRTEEETEQEGLDAVIRRVEAEERLRRDFGRQALEEDYQTLIDSGVPKRDAMLLVRGMRPEASPESVRQELMDKMILDFATTKTTDALPGSSTPSYRPRDRTSSEIENYAKQIGSVLDILYPTRSAALATPQVSVVSPTSDAFDYKNIQRFYSPRTSEGIRTIPTQNNGSLMTYDHELFYQDRE